MVRFYIAKIQKVIALNSGGDELDDSYDKLSTSERKKATPTFEIRFIIPNIITNMEKYPKAIPLYLHTRELHVDDPIIILQFNHEVHEFGYYPIEIDNKVQLSNGNAQIDLTDEGIVDIKIVDDLNNSDPKILTNVKLTNEEISLTINDTNGNMKSQYKLTQDEVVTKVGDQCTVTQTESDIKLESASNNITVDKSSINLSKGTLGKLTIDGTVTPTGSGPLCGVPFCLFTGAPHSGSTAMSNTGIKLE